MFVSQPPPSTKLHGAAPPVVTPEGTAPTSMASTMSVTSLIPLKRRIPQAPVFITRNAPPTTSFISDASTPPHNTYFFDDDYPSIGASESTAPPEPLRAHQSTHQPYPTRPSVTGAIRRRISQARRHDERMLPLPHTLSQKFRRASIERDSVIDDWNRSRKRSSAATSTRFRHPHPRTCSPFVFRSLFTRQNRPTTPQPSVPFRQPSVQPVQPPLSSTTSRQQQRRQPRAVVQGSPRQPHEEINFMSTLAYDDFMCGRNRPTKPLRMFARLRRS